MDSRTLEMPNFLPLLSLMQIMVDVETHVDRLLVMFSLWLGELCLGAANAKLQWLFPLLRLSMSPCAQQMVWMQNWLDEVAIKHDMPGVIKGNSQGAIVLMYQSLPPLTETYIVLTITTAVLFTPLFLCILTILLVQNKYTKSDFQFFAQKYVKQWVIHSLTF